MSFSKTISTIAALASIFGAGAAGWKLAQDNSQTQQPILDQRIEQLEQQLEEAKKEPVATEAPQPMSLPTPAPVLTPAPQPATLPPVAPPPPPAPAETQP